MPITVQCVCGKQFKILDELAGKRVKCPACQQVVNVPGGAAVPDDLPAAPLDDDAEPSKKKKKAGMDPQKRKMLILGGSIGGAVLLLSCCCLGGFGMWWFVLSGPGDPEKVIVGKWVLTYDIAGGVETGMPTMEFRKDGDYSETFGLVTNGRWKMVSKSGNTIKVEVTTSRAGFGGSNTNETRQLEITVISGDRIDIRSMTAGMAKYKRTN